MKWYWPNAILRTIRVNKEKSLFKDPIIVIEESQNDNEDNSNEPAASYAMNIADRAQTSTKSREPNLKSVYQQRLNDFLGTDESGSKEKRVKDEEEEEEGSEHECEIERKGFKGEDEKRGEEELSDKEERDDDNEDEYEDDGEVKFFKEILVFVWLIEPVETKTV